MSEELFMALVKELADLVNGGEVKQARAKLVRAVVGTDPRFADNPGPVDDLHEAAWRIIANAGGGNWAHETSEWQEAAAQWRGVYHDRLKIAMGDDMPDPAARVPLATTPTTPAEALFAFMGWLTSRDPVAGPFSSRHNASQGADLVAEYARIQGWEDPRPGWQHLIKPAE